MNVLIVGNVLKDVYLNLDPRTEKFETNNNNVAWLDLSFNASEHRFYNRNSSFGGAAITLEVLEKMGIKATISNSDLSVSDEGLVLKSQPETHRYILIADGKVSYLVPTNYKKTTFEPPSEAVDYLFIDRSAEIDIVTAKKINAYLDISPNTKLILFVRNFDNINLNDLIPRASLLFLEENNRRNDSDSSIVSNIDPKKIVHISENQLSYLNISEKISVDRVDMLTHLSIYSILASTVVGSFILGYSVEDSLKMAKINLENSKLDSTLSLDEIKRIIKNYDSGEDLELIAAMLVLPNKGILAADESGGSIQKKFAQLNIPDTYENRRNYRNIFFSTPDLEKYINGVILFEETTKQIADNGQNFVDYLIGRRIVPGIKVDQGLAPLNNSSENYTKGLDGLSERLKEYYLEGLRFAKWRAAFEINLDEKNITPSDYAINENCRILAEYAKECQSAGLVPIVEPEVVYSGYYPIEKNIEITSKILDVLFEKLTSFNVNLRACILKVNMILAGKDYETQSTPEEVGKITAKVLKEHVPEKLAGVVFLSGGQTPEQATANLSEIIKNGPFPWPVTFSFARALQDPALFTWKGDENNFGIASEAFLSRLKANIDALKNEP